MKSKKDVPDFKKVKRKLGKKVPTKETKLDFKTRGINYILLIKL